MNSETLNTPVVTGLPAGGLVTEPSISWRAVLAGAIGAASLSLILVVLGTGLGMTLVSPWANQGATGAAIGVAAILWLSFTQLAASGVGGYLSGRLRPHWQGTQRDEVYFRDTAHGFLAWGVATLMTAAVLSSTVASIATGGAKAAAAVAGTTTAAAATAATAGASSMSREGQSQYFVDALLRKNSTVAPAPAATSSQPQAPMANPATGDASSNPERLTSEIGTIMSSAKDGGALPPDDAKYLAQLVAQNTGLSAADAEKRVTETVARMQAKAKETETAARDAADKARKATAYAALWTVVSLLIGAFVASLAATFGGRHRDQY